jgi:hypothetical protein
MRHFVGSSGILLMGIFTRGFVFHLLAVMLNNTPGRGAQDCVMSGDVADDTSNGRSFQASFGIPQVGQYCEAEANGETGSNLAHFHSPGRVSIA